MEKEVTLKTISDWQIKHELDDSRNFGEIRDMLINVADKKSIETIVSSAVQITVNGKLDSIKNHLNEQDTILTELNNKIIPLDKSREWLSSGVKVLAYIAAIIGSIGVIAGGIAYLSKLIE